MKVDCVSASTANSFLSLVVLLYAKRTHTISNQSLKFACVVCNKFIVQNQDLLIQLKTYKRFHVTKWPQGFNCKGCPVWCGVVVSSPFMFLFHNAQKNIKNLDNVLIYLLFKYVVNISKQWYFNLKSLLILHSTFLNDLQHLSGEILPLEPVQIQVKTEHPEKVLSIFCARNDMCIYLYTGTSFIIKLYSVVPRLCRTKAAYPATGKFQSNRIQMTAIAEKQNRKSNGAWIFCI